MKLYTKIHLMASGVMVVVGSAIAAAGFGAITELTFRFEREVMMRKVDNVLEKIENAHAILKFNHLERFDSYVVQAQSEVLHSLADYRFSDSGRLIIVDGNGLVVKHDTLPPGTPCDIPDTDSWIKNGAGEVQFSYHGKERLFRYQIYPEWQWLVILCADMDEILSARTRFLQQVASILAISLLAGTLFLMWFAKKIVTPIRRLVHATTLVSQGKWDEALPVAVAGDEVGALTRSFRSMALNLADMYRDLEHHVRELEISEKELAKSEERYRIVFDNTGTGMILSESNGTLSMVNAGFVKMTGYAKEEIENKMNVGQFIHPEDQEWVRSYHLHRRRSKKNIPENLECRLIDREGNVKYITLKVRMIPGTNTSVGSFLDITESKRVESQLRQAQKMDSIGRLAGGIAHDFNNMLGVILGQAELAKIELDPEDPLNENLEKITRSAGYSADLTRQLLAFARKQTVVPQVIDLNETVEGMLKMLRRLIGEDLDLAWVPAKPLQPVKIDPTQVQQVLTNLCVNARDAIKGVGRLTIETADVFFDDAYCESHLGFTTGAFTMLAVSDNGPGMAKETLDNLFEPFFTTKDIGEGTGLGLATVYGIVKQNNGFINVYSEPEQGSTFRVYLPVTMDDGERREISALCPLDAEKEKGDETVLIVEDEPSILELTQEVLTRYGYRVMTADTPSEGLQRVMSHEEKIDLLLTDVVMPEMNGKELTHRVREEMPGIKVLFMSGYTANVIVDKGVLQNRVNFLEKPFAVDQLLAKVREVLDSNSIDDGPPL